MQANGIFAGGGIKGIAHLGAASVASEKGIVWRKLAGTSVGGLVAALLSAGYTAEECLELILDFDFTQILDPLFEKQLPALGLFAGIFLEKGMYQGRALENWIKSLLKARGVSTFADLPPGKLSLIAADLTQQRLVIMPHDLPRYGLDPGKFSVARAVRCSASLPFVFEPVLVKHKSSASYFVDGGLVSNFPSWLFQREIVPTLGFAFANEVIPKKINHLWEYLEALVGTAIGGCDERARCALEQLILLPDVGISTVDFRLTKTQKLRLYNAGVTAARDFFTSFSS